MTKLLIRKASIHDAASIREIYLPYVENSTVTLEIEVPSVDELECRMQKTLKSFPYLVALEDDKIIGYAYAGKFRQRQGYSHCAEISLYLRENNRGKGLGHALLTSLENALIEQDISTLVSVIESSNTGSLKFHEKNGFIQSGFLPRIGYKFDRWLDIHLLTKQIQI